jgi:hypothetical protein
MSKNESLNSLQQWKQTLGETRPWDLVNPNTEWADEDKAKERFYVCKACPELIKLTTQCKKCGCFMKAKVKLEQAVCPIGKW